MYGNKVLASNDSRGRTILKYALLAYANVAFVAVILLSKSVPVEAGEIERTGWYGQVSVIAVFTYLLELLFCVFFVCALRKPLVRNSEEQTGYTDYMGYHHADPIKPATRTASDGSSARSDDALVDSETNTAQTQV